MLSFWLVLVLYCVSWTAVAAPVGSLEDNDLENGPPVPSDEPPPLQILKKLMPIPTIRADNVLKAINNDRSIIETLFNNYQNGPKLSNTHLSILRNSFDDWEQVFREAKEMFPEDHDDSIKLAIFYILSRPVYRYLRISSETLFGLHPSLTRARVATDPVMLYIKKVAEERGHRLDLTSFDLPRGRNPSTLPEQVIAFKADQEPTLPPIVRSVEKVLLSSIWPGIIFAVLAMPFVIPSTQDFVPRLNFFLEMFCFILTLYVQTALHDYLHPSFSFRILREGDPEFGGSARSTEGIVEAYDQGNQPQFIQDHINRVKKTQENRMLMMTQEAIEARRPLTHIAAIPLLTANQILFLLRQRGRALMDSFLNQRQELSDRELLLVVSSFDNWSDIFQKLQSDLKMENEENKSKIMVAVHEVIVEHILQSMDLSLSAMREGLKILKDRRRTPPEIRELAEELARPIITQEFSQLPKLLLDYPQLRAVFFDMTRGLIF